MSAHHRQTPGQHQAKRVCAARKHLAAVSADPRSTLRDLARAREDLNRSANRYPTRHRSFEENMMATSADRTKDHAEAINDAARAICHHHRPVVSPPEGYRIIGELAAARLALALTQIAAALAAAPQHFDLYESHQEVDPATSLNAEALRVAVDHVTTLGVALATGQNHLAGIGYSPNTHKAATGGLKK
jgi:hypothetical protein